MTITINIENENSAAEAVMEVARLIEEGYTNGFIGVSADTFEIEY